MSIPAINHNIRIFFASFLRGHWPVIALTGIFFVFRLLYLASQPYAFGIDGYYYAAQAHSFRFHGRFFSPESSPVLYLMVAASYVFRDIVFANKVIIALLGALTVPASFALGRRISGTRAGGILSVFVLSCNSQVMILHFEFVKNLGGLCALLYFLIPVYDILCSYRRDARVFVYLLIGLAFAFSCHKLTGAVALIIFAGIVIFLFRRRMVFLFVPLILLSLVAVVITWTSSLLPNLLHRTDFSRFNDSFTATPQWAVYSHQILTQQPMVFFIESIVMTAAALAAGLWIFRRKLQSGALPQSAPFVVLSILLLAVFQFPFLNFSDYDLAYRLFLLTFLPGGISLIFLLDRARLCSGYLFIYLTIFALTIYQTYAFYRIGAERRIDYALYSRLENRLDDRFHRAGIADTVLLIAHQGMDYFFCYSSGLDAFHFLAEDQHRSRPVYRLVFGMAPEDWALYASRRKIEYLEGSYSLVKEADWQTFMKNIPTARRQIYLNWHNPFEHRPDFMLRNYRKSAAE